MSIRPTIKLTTVCTQKHDIDVLTVHHFQLD